MQEDAGRMYHVVHLLFFFLFVLPERKRSVELCKRENNIFKACFRINNTQYSFQKNKLPFKLLKPHLELKSISKYQLLLHWKSFENIWSFILYLEAGETQLINTCVVPFAIVESVTNVLKQHPHLNMNP